MSDAYCERCERRGFHIAVLALALIAAVGFGVFVAAELTATMGRLDDAQTLLRERGERGGR